MPIVAAKIQRTMDKMAAEDAAAKPERKDRKSRWARQSLEESLYNEVGGVRAPRASDIDQGSQSHLNYLLKKRQIGDCYLLTNLISLARKNPNFIMTKLIYGCHTDIVNVAFFETEVSYSREKDGFSTLVYKPTGIKGHLGVNKKEALSWKASHKALWPVVIEIAYAKHLLSNSQPLGFLGRMIPHHNIDDLREILNAGKSAETLAHLTGAITKHKYVSDDHEVRVQKFESQDYLPQVLKIYIKIQKKLAQGKIITVGFKGRNPLVSGSTGTLKTDKFNLAFGIREILDILRSTSCETFIKDAIRKGILNGPALKSFLEDNGLIETDGTEQFHLLRTLPVPTLTKFVLEKFDLEKFMKFSKTQSGIGGAHAYLIIGTLEHDGYKYIVIKNTSQIKTRINYRKSSKLPREVRLPEQIPEKTECMMELNHFYKKLLTLDYDK